MSIENHVIKYHRVMQNQDINRAIEILKGKQKEIEDTLHQLEEFKDDEHLSSTYQDFQADLKHVNGCIALCNDRSEELNK